MPNWPTLYFIRKKNSGCGDNDGGSDGKGIIFFGILNANILAIC